jgi:hypothetical protein
VPDGDIVDLPPIIGFCKVSQADADAPPVVLWPLLPVPKVALEEQKDGAG